MTKTITLNNIPVTREQLEAKLKEFDQVLRSDLRPGDRFGSKDGRAEIMIIQECTPGPASLTSAPAIKLRQGSTDTLQVGLVGDIPLSNFQPNGYYSKRLN